MIEILEHQAKFLESEKRHTGLVGGYRSGKSEAGVWKTVLRKVQLDGVNVAYYLPTYRLIKDMAYEKFSRILELQNIDYELNQTGSTYDTPFGKIFLRSMDKPESIIAYEVGYSLVDECDVISKVKMQKIMKKIIARNSAATEGHNSTDFVSTPEGYNFLYDFFVKDSANPDKLLIQASTRSNPFISKDYIKSLEDTYTKEELDAYLEGRFVNFTGGNVFRTFTREQNHSDREIQKSDVLHIGIDFNITNMSAVVRVKDGAISTAVAEHTGIYDTAQLAQVLRDQYEGHNIVLYPDASGNARNTAGESDFKILKKAGFRIRANVKNPRVRERVTKTNALFLNGSGETKAFVNTDNCPALTEAYEKLGYKNGEPDKMSGYDHITDADTYCLYLLHRSL